MTSKLGIIIPNWNGEKHLRAMLDSILVQTYKDWQVYVVDDCSTDNSWLILTTYAERDTRIHVFKRNRLPKGAQTCRNIGIDLAKDSEYLCFFDSDDILAPWCFEQRVSFMEENPEVECGIFPAKSFSGDDLLNSGSFVFGFDIFNESILESMLQDPLPIVGWTNIYRMSSLKKYNLYWDEKILSKQDSDYNITALVKGVNYVYAKNVHIDYFWRIDNTITSITKTISSKEHTNSHIYRIEKFIELLPEDFKQKKGSLVANYLMIQFRNFERSKNVHGIKLLLNNKFFINNRCKKLLFSIIYLTPTLGNLLSSQRKERLIYPRIIKSQSERWKVYQEFISNMRNKRFGLTELMLQEQ